MTPYRHRQRLITEYPCETRLSWLPIAFALAGSLLLIGILTHCCAVLLHAHPRGW